MIKNHWILGFVLIVALLMISCRTLIPGSIPTPTPGVPLPPPPGATPFQPVPLTTTAPEITVPAPTQAVEPGPTTTPEFTYRPVFEPGDCRFPIPPATAPECGDLIVPENRLNPTTRFIRLHIAIFRSKSALGSPPTIFLAGGPGSSALGLSRYIFGQGLDRFLENGDFILFDQRGTGYSQPALTCPERIALAPRLLEANLAPQEVNDLVTDAFQACHDRLVAEGADLSAYNSAASAADIDDLRQALGYDQVNLYGLSYGTRLALTVMRDFSAGLRSVILDSAYPPQVNLYTELAPNAQRAFDVFFANCREQPACNAAYPDLESRFYQLVEALNASPASVQMRDPVKGQSLVVKLTGSLLADVFFTGLYNPVVAQQMPGMITEVEQGNFSYLTGRLELYFYEDSALGMSASVQCREEAPFGSLGEAYLKAAGIRPEITDAFVPGYASLLEVCQLWEAGEPESIENQPVASDLPVLILAGESDPITPPDWGRLAGQTLPNSLFYEFPAQGHWILRSSACGIQMALEFQAQPEQAPAMECGAGH